MYIVDFDYLLRYIQNSLYKSIMSITVATIYFNDTASKFNKDLTEFLKRNIEKSIRQGRLSYSFKITQTNELAELRRMGIKRLPAMVIGKTTRVGVPDIIDEIHKRVKNSKSPAPPKTEDEIVREYQLAALGDIKKDADGKIVIKDDDPDDANGDDLQHRLQKENERRGLALQGAASGDPSERLRPKPQPRAPDRTADRDDDFEDRRPPPVTQGNRGYATPRDQARPRPDNLDNPQMGDAFASLNRVGRNASVEDRKDDELMASLLSKIGGGD